MNKSKITKPLAVFASVILIIIIGVASFAYFGTFNVNLNNNVAVNVNAYNIVQEMQYLLQMLHS